MFTGIDLGAKEVNFCFGLAGDRTIAQSAYRYRGLPRAERELAIKAVDYHELGHILGCAADLRRANTVRDLGNHCTVDGCIMRQGHNLDEWLDHAKRAKAKHRIFCPQCMIEPKRGVARL
jgi:predicted Zn-dependent protease